MPYKCSIYGCKGNYDTGQKVSIFQFPKDPQLKQIWSSRLMRNDFKPTKNSRHLVAILSVLILSTLLPAVCSDDEVPHTHAMQNSTERMTTLQTGKFENSSARVSVQNHDENNRIKEVSTEHSAEKRAMLQIGKFESPDTVLVLALNASAESQMANTTENETTPPTRKVENSSVAIKVQAQEEASTVAGEQIRNSANTTENVTTGKLDNSSAAIEVQAQEASTVAGEQIRNSTNTTENVTTLSTGKLENSSAAIKVRAISGEQTRNSANTTENVTTLSTGKLENSSAAIKVQAQEEASTITVEQIRNSTETMATNPMRNTEGSDEEMPIENSTEKKSTPPIEKTETSGAALVNAPHMSFCYVLLVLYGLLCLNAVPL